ncbi:unnamed protein product [Urochloa humidicola]
MSPSPPHLLASIAPLFLPPQAPLKYSSPATSQASLSVLDCCLPSHCSFHDELRRLLQQSFTVTRALPASAGLHEYLGIEE